MRPRGGTTSGVPLELSGRNEGKPHLLSLEKHKAGKPSRCGDGEGYHAAATNRQLGAVDSGGVSEANTAGRTTRINWANSHRATATSQLPVEGGNPAKAGQATGAVGVLRRSNEPAYNKGAGERRGHLGQCNWKQKGPGMAREPDINPKDAPF